MTNNINNNININNETTFQTIKQMIMTPSKMIQTTELSVNSYQQVVDLWIQYKNGKTQISDYIIKSAFEFHLNKFDHIIMYHSYNMNKTLLMCRIRENYKNIVVDNNLLKDIDYFNKYKPNFIATYC